MDEENKRVIENRVAFRKLYDEEFLQKPWVSRIIYLLDTDYLPKPDWAHSTWHTEMVREYAIANASLLPITDRMRQNIERASVFHDLSNPFIDLRLVSISEHHCLAEVITYLLTHDIEISALVYNHNADSSNHFVIPEGSNRYEFHLASKVLRDADQLAFMGWSGLIRKLYYKGYRDPEMYESYASQRCSGNLFDMRLEDGRLPLDYEWKVRRHALESLIPFIAENNLMEYALEHLNYNFYRFFGNQPNGKDERKIEGMIYEYRERYFIKMEIEHEIRQILRRLIELKDMYKDQTEYMQMVNEYMDGLESPALNNT